MKTIKSLLLAGLVTFTLYSFTTLVQEGWNVPAEYETMANPTADDDATIAAGKALYNKQCKSCHGAEGYGDGPKAEDLDGDLGDFSSEDFQGQTDGNLFYKITFGKDDMPNYDKKLPNADDRWKIVRYMRTLKE